MRKRFSILLFILLLSGIMARGRNVGAETVESERIAQGQKIHQRSAESTEGRPGDSAFEASGQTKEPQTDQDILVVYFSATGTTKAVAEKIASIEEADLYEIIPAKPYSDADLDYHDANSRTSLEQCDPDIRPEIGSETISPEDYRVIYLGYPIWHGQAPRIMTTFVEAYSFEGITMIPFCTSAGSGMGQSAIALKEQAESGSWLTGERFPGNVSEDDLRTWIQEMK